MADACESQRARLRALEIELKDSQPVPGEPKPAPQLNELIRRIDAARDQLNACIESTSSLRWTVTGETFLGAFAIDRAIKRFMMTEDIRAMSFAIAREGVVIGKRGYTWASPDYPKTQPDTLFRVASVSKIFTCAAIDQLTKTGALGLNLRAFPFLGVTALPLTDPDPEMDNITVQQLATRKSGLADDVEGEIRSIAKMFGTTSRPTPRQVLQYIYGTELVAHPGTFDKYSNMAFTVLTAIVEKASGVSFIEYLRSALLTPLGIVDVHVGATAAALRRADEVATYEAPGDSPSHLDMGAKATAPDAHGGKFALEQDVGAGGLIMSTATIARFVATHAVWEIGARESNGQLNGRYGKFAGSGSAALCRPDGIDYAFAFNRELDYPEYNLLRDQLQPIIDEHLIVRRETLDTVLASLALFARRVVDAIRDVVARRLNP
jgi:CubicO group peptidase (beta-lactamase class C family)